MTREFCDICDRDMTDERYERYHLVLYYTNGTPSTKERHLSLICAECVKPITDMFGRRIAA